MDDEGIRAAFHEAVATLDPPVERLVAGAMARGRRRTLVMRAGGALSVTAVLSGAAALVVALLPGPADHRSSAIGPGGPSSGSVPTTDPAAATRSAPALPATVTMTPQALLQTALDTLPRHGTTSGYAGNFDGNSFVGTQFVYDDGDGAAQIDVAMQYPQATSTAHPPEPIRPCRAGDDNCSVLSDGARAQGRQGPEFTDGRQPGLVEWDLDLVRPDGVKVTIYEWNSRQEKDAPVSRPEPPFSLAELTGWADSARFQVQISPSRASAAADLFRPVDLRAPDENGSMTPEQQHRVEQRNCRTAKLIHKTPPSYCSGG